MYPAVFTEDKHGLAVEFPDLPGCYTCGDDLGQAFTRAREALGLHLYGMEQDGEAIPAPTGPAALMSGLKAGQSVALVETWMPLIRGEAELRAVKKTLTVPKWLADLAEHHKVNFSHVLQEALKEHLGLTPPPFRSSIVEEAIADYGRRPAPRGVDTPYPRPKQRGSVAAERPPDDGWKK